MAGRALSQLETLLRPGRCRPVSYTCWRHAHLGWRGSQNPSARGRRTPETDSAAMVRNVGIVAHIDAGKTTVTERLLYYSGAIAAMGEVHDGAATMDFLEQERERGITVGAAAVSIPWKKHRINIIDTPGHADFTLEVERSLRVLDGTVLVLDASAGVEAQTLTVWRQATNYHLPAIAFLNKMDKPNADLESSVRSIEERLRVPPLLLQLPLGEGPDFSGVVDLAEMQRLTWRRDGDGAEYLRRELSESADGAVWERAAAARARLVEQTADLDDCLATQYLESDAVSLISADALYAALRRVALRRSGLPTLCGAAYKNTGVQPLMDAILELLPSPSERKPPAVEHYGSDLCALAFKTVHCKQRGLLTYIRVYSGHLCRGQKLYNVSRKCAERLGRVMTPSADQLTDEEEVKAGHIAVVSGLKSTLTGDTLASSQSAASAARRRAGDDQAAVLLGVAVPEPVFFCSVEPPSLSKARALDAALECLQKEDPSLRVEVNEETGQTVLSGMGELHLAIVKNRILREHGVDADFGDPQVSYRETPSGSVDGRERLQKRISDMSHDVEIHLHLQIDTSAPQPPKLKLAPTEESAEQLRGLHPRVLAAAQKGVRSALAHGPLLGSPVVHVQPYLSWLQRTPRTADHVVSAAAARCTSALLREVGCQLLEPVMTLTVTTDASHLGTVLADLATRQAIISSVTEWRGEKRVVSETPLSELRGYSTILRTLSSGMASFSMELSAYQPMSADRQDSAIESVTGFRPR